MKYLLVILFLGMGLFVNAQEVERNGKKYVVKKGKILHAGNDITATFSMEEQAAIKRDFSILVEHLKQKEKDEKKQKKAEKELKRNEKMQSNYDKAVKRYEQTQKNMSA